MKSKITTLIVSILILFLNQSFAQNTLDFEPAGTGAAYTWTVTENGTNPSLTFIANPNTTGINTSATVTEFIAEQAGNPWALCFTDDLGSITFDTTNTTIKIMVWKPTISNVGIKFEGAGGINHEVLVPNTVTNQWEELTFNFSSQIGQTYTRLVIIPDFDLAGRTQDNTLYFDNIEFTSGGQVAVSDSVEVTFTINAADITTSPDGLFLAGGALFGVPGDNPMTDNGSDVWTITKTVEKGASFDYTFTNGNCPDWSCKEDISGQSCAVAPYNDRQLTGAYSDTTILACFADCTSDGTCSGVTPVTMIDVTFQVDMSAETVDVAGVFIGGNFEGWTGTLPLTDNNSDGIWEVTVAIEENDSIEWKFLNGGWTNAETFDTINYTDCTLTTFGENDIFVNRFAVLSNIDTTLETFIYNSCDITSNTKTVLVQDALFEITPTLVNDFTIINFKDKIANADKQLQIVNAVGQVVINETIGQIQQYHLDASQLNNGLYFVNIQSKGFAYTTRIIVSK